MVKKNKKKEIISERYNILQFFNVDDDDTPINENQEDNFTLSQDRFLRSNVILNEDPKYVCNGDKILIENVEFNKDSKGKVGIVESIDEYGKMHGTWGDYTVDIHTDDFKVITEAKKKSKKKSSRKNKDHELPQGGLHPHKENVPVIPEVGTDKSIAITNHLLGSDNLGGGSSSTASSGGEGGGCACGESFESDGKTALEEIFNNINSGKVYGKFEKGPVSLYFWEVLSAGMGRNGEQFIFWNHFGSSAEEDDIKSLKWLLETIFKTTPEQFIKEYECVTQEEINSRLDDDEIKDESFELEKQHTKMPIKKFNKVKR